MELDELIRQAWLNAKENDYESVLLVMSPMDLASDMYDYDAAISEYPLTDVQDAVVRFINNGYK